MKVHAKFLTVSALILVLLAGLSGCIPAQKAGLTDQQVASVTENILKAIDKNNYPAFIHDFSPQMKSAFPQAKFTQLQTLLSTSSGKFIYIDAPSISNNQGFVIYRYPTKYAGETVTVTVTFVIGGQEVEGLFFDSAALRKVSQ
jgi:hypothetical protein